MRTRPPLYAAHAAVLLALALPAGAAPALAASDPTPSVTSGAISATPTTTPTATPTPVPDRTTWKADVAEVMAGAKEYLMDRVTTAAPDERLAINLDIDNTSLATYYDRGRPVRKVRNLARLADQLGIAVLFNTGRLKRNLNGVDQRLGEVGYDVSTVCTRKRGEELAEGKQRCRRSFVDAGYTLVLNIGNNRTDFQGGDYEKAYRLPNYDGLLG